MPNNARQLLGQDSELRAALSWWCVQPLMHSGVIRTQVWPRAKKENIHQRKNFNREEMDNFYLKDEY